MTQKSPTSTPLLIAHRGFSARYPENTMIAFDEALRLPIDGMEIDLQWTRDQIAVCYHDRTLHKVGGGKVAIRNRRLAELAEVDTGAWFEPPFPGQRLPFLEEVLDRYGQHTFLMLEIKRRELGNRARLQGLMGEVIRMVRDRKLEKRVAILCFDFELLRWGYRRDPSLRFVLNQTEPRLIDGDEFLYAYDVRTSALNRPFIEAVHQRQKKIFTYRVNRLNDLQRLLAWGIDGVMTDDPAWLTETMESLT